jgi:hypothetical protein
MDEKVRALDTFVKLHANRLPSATGEPLAYLVPHGPSISLTVKLMAYSRDDIAKHFDTTNTTVNWLLKQMTDTDHFSASIIGLTFDDGSILAHTIRRGAIRRPGDDDDSD